MAGEEVLSVDLVTVLLSILIHEHSAEVLCEQLRVGPQIQLEMPSAHKQSKKQGESKSQRSLIRFVTSATEALTFDLHPNGTLVPI